jgi:hypothetical protein
MPFWLKAIITQRQSIPDVLLVIFNAVAIQKRAKLVLIRFRGDVPPDCGRTPLPRRDSPGLLKTFHIRAANRISVSSAQRLNELGRFALRLFDEFYRRVHSSHVE